MIKEKTKKKKVNAPATRTTQTKGQFPQDEGKTKEEKNQYDRGMEMEE